MVPMPWTGGTLVQGDLQSQLACPRLAVAGGLTAPFPAFPKRGIPGRGEIFPIGGADSSELDVECPFRQQGLARSHALPLDS